MRCFQAIYECVKITSLVCDGFKVLLTAFFSPALRKAYIYISFSVLFFANVGFVIETLLGYFII